MRFKRPLILSAWVLVLSAAQFAVFLRLAAPGAELSSTNLWSPRTEVLLAAVFTVIPAFPVLLLLERLPPSNIASAVRAGASTVGLLGQWIATCRSLFSVFESGWSTYFPDEEWYHVKQTGVPLWVGSCILWIAADLCSAQHAPAVAKQRGGIR